MFSPLGSSLFRNVELMSIRWISQSSNAAMESRIWIDLIQATGAYISKKIEQNDMSNHQLEMLQILLEQAAEFLMLLVF